MKTFLWFCDCVMPKVFHNSCEDSGSGSSGGSGTFEARPDSPPAEMWNAALTCRWTPDRPTDGPNGSPPDREPPVLSGGEPRLGFFGRQRPDGGLYRESPPSSSVSVLYVWNISIPDRTFLSRTPSLLAHQLRHIHRANAA